MSIKFPHLFLCFLCRFLRRKLIPLGRIVLPLLLLVWLAGLQFPVLSTYAQTPPYDDSPVIEELVWADEESIRRAADGSDNFPLTWADDDNLYGAFGDGFGFEPLLKQKLSLGFFRLEGGPSNFVGTTIRSIDEVPGDGPLTEKASGILMVDSVLYLWTRNVIQIGDRGGGCLLSWSIRPWVCP